MDAERSRAIPGDAAFQVLPSPLPAPLDGVEPFGFVDGISQPVLDWERSRVIDGRDQLEYGNVLSLGEILLGYPNEYGKYTDRPLVDRQDDRGAELSPADDAPELRDLGRNGTYLVVRQLRQDVQGFWQFLRAPGERRPGGGARAGRGDGGADADGRSAPRGRRPPDSRRRPARP